MTIWSGQAHRIESSRIFKPSLSSSTFGTNTIKIDVDCSRAGTWCEIDAVKLIGIKTKVRILRFCLSCLLFVSSSFGNIAFLFSLDLSGNI